MDQKLQKIDIYVNVVGSDPDSKVHGANMGPTWVPSAPDGLHVGPMNLAIRGPFNLMVIVMEFHSVS